MSDSPHDTYQSPLASRYASDEMQRLWSARHKFQTWRRIWLAVAKAQHEVTKEWETPLVSAEQVAELEANLDVTDADMESAAKYEKELRHDVMAHVHAWGDRCPKAKGIIHLGMTSQDVNDNCELLQIHDAFDWIKIRTEDLLHAFGGLIDRSKEIPALAFTHYQPAQPTTFGRRAAQWAHDLDLVSDRPEILYRGLRGATGTQASFNALFDGDAGVINSFDAEFLDRLFELEETGERFEGSRTDEELRTRIEKIEALRDVLGDSEDVAGGVLKSMYERDLAMTPEQRLADDRDRFAKSWTFSLTTQTYPRVYDAVVVTHLANIAAVLHKCATDLRLLCNRKEIDEPFEENQIGSSAMPYKRNPMRCERVCALARFVMNLVGNTYETAATQWLERTLDDSANRRLVLPEAFLATEACLNIMHNVISGLVVHEAQVKKNLMAELPFLATENIMMEAVKAGGDRQELHEVIRKHAQHVAWRIKQEGAENDLIDRLKADPAFASVKDRLTEGDLLDPMKYIGRAVEQTERFIAEVIDPLREERDDDDTTEATELKV